LYVIVANMTPATNRNTNLPPTINQYPSGSDSRRYLPPPRRLVDPVRSSITNTTNTYVQISQTTRRPKVIDYLTKLRMSITS